MLKFLEEDRVMSATHSEIQKKKKKKMDWWKNRINEQMCKYMIQQAQ